MWGKSKQRHTLAARVLKTSKLLAKSKPNRRTQTRLRMFSSSRPGKIITTAQLPRGAVPAFLAVGGLFDADWRLAVACRNGKIYAIKVPRPNHSALRIRRIFHLEFIHPARDAYVAEIKSRASFGRKAKVMYVYRRNHF